MDEYILLKIPSTDLFEQDNMVYQEWKEFWNVT